jgi:hypothetical protein
VFLHPVNVTRRFDDLGSLSDISKIFKLRQSGFVEEAILFSWNSVVVQLVLAKRLGELLRDDMRRGEDEDFRASEDIGNQCDHS